MKNTLNKYSKLIVFSFGIVAALIFVVSLIYFTEWVNLSTDYKDGALDTTVRSFKAVMVAYYDSTSYATYWTNVDTFYRSAQAFNQALFNFSVIMLVLWAVTLITSNQSRIKFYLSNLISGVVVNTTAIIYTVIILIKNFGISSLFNKYNEECNVYDLATRLGSASNCTTIIKNDGKEAFQGYFALTNNISTVVTIVCVVFILVAVINLAFTVTKYLDSRRKVEA